MNYINFLYVATLSNNRYTRNRSQTFTVPNWYEAVERKCSYEIVSLLEKYVVKK